MSDARNLVPALIGGAITALVLVGWFSRKAKDPREPFSWALAYGVEVTPTNKAMIVWFVRAFITLRVTGAVAGLVLGSLFDRAFLLRTSTGVGFWVWVILGWILGGCWAEARVIPRNPTGVPAASLTPRRVSDYLPASVHWAPPAAALITASVAMLGIIVGPPTTSNGVPLAQPNTTGFVLLAAGSVLIAMLALWQEGRVVDRRQPAWHPDLIATDDAIRASVVHLIGAGSTAAILLMGAHAVNGVLLPRQLPFGIRSWVPLLFILGAFFASRYYVYRAWQVRRPVSENRPTSSSPARSAAPGRQSTPATPS